MAVAASIVAAGVLSMPALAGATSNGGVDKVELNSGEPLRLTGKCNIDGKPGRVIGVIALLHKSTTTKTTFSAWADADKDGSFAVAVNFSKTVTVEETYVAGALCVSKHDKKKHHVVKETRKCVWPKPHHPKPSTTTTTKPKPTTTEAPEASTTTTKAPATTTTVKPTTETPETPTPEEVEKVITEVAKVKITTTPSAVKATPKFTG
jgi:hypothetical protein